MLVGERMSKPVIHIAPDMPMHDALDLMRNENIRRTPVVKDGQLLGIVTDVDLLHASPSDATSLSIWEMNYLLSKITVDEVMTKEVISVNEDTPIEVAARIMADNKIGGLPVLSDDKLVGIITETDLFNIFLELMGAREQGVRLTLLVPDKPGVLSQLGAAISAENGNLIAVGTFAGRDQTNREMMIKVVGVEEGRLKEIVEPQVEAMLDIRTC